MGALDPFTGLARTATAESQRIQAGIKAQAMRVARLEAKGRKLRRAERDNADALREARRFLRAMIRDLDERPGGR